MKTKSFLFLLISIALFACKETPIVDYQIIPHPNTIIYSSGSFTLNNDAKVYFTEEVESEAKLLKDYLSSDFGANLEFVGQDKDADIILELDKKYNSEKMDGYKLDIDKRNIAITSNSRAGILNGIQSLRQIIRKEGDKLLIQQGVINDYPAFSWRAFMLDEGRHFKGKEVVKSLLDEMSLLKMNVFHWHLTEDQGWRIEIKKYPLLTEIGSHRDSTEINHFHSEVFDGKPHSGFYTQEEIKEIVAYADKLHIRVVPEIEMPGHSSAAIAAYPWLGVTGKQIKVPTRFGVQYDVYDVTNQRVLDFFSDVFDEIIELFPSPVIHIGGDEIRYDQWNNSYKVRSYMRKHDLKTPAELQVFFTNNISNMLKEKGKRMMGWNEITGAKLHDYQSDQDTEESSQKLADGTIVHFWKGDSALIINTIKSGYDVVNSFHEYTYLDYNYESIPLSKAYSFNPIPNGLPQELEDKVLGMGCQMWGEFIPTVESMQKKVFPRIAAYAETAWTSPANKNYDNFLESLDYFLERWEKEGIVYGRVE
ncbi:MAG: beta-N-acetylhexosaminidase [Dysgonamonadaceae bacterium]|nr:beta-N-acetylhexosaminidase [Dysgonamonadaceae bacterium]